MIEELLEKLSTGYEVEINEGKASSALNAAITDFEKKTQIIPFLYDKSETKEIVVTAGRGNKEGADVVFLENYVNEEVIEIDGVALVRDVDYELTDRSMIAFFTRKLPAGLKINITGKWGFSQSYPEDVKHAIMQKAICTVLESEKPSLLLANRIEISTLRIEFSGVNNNLRKQLLTTYDETVELYRFNQGYIG